MADVSLVVDLQVDAEAPVDAGRGTVDVQVGDAALDDLGEDLAGALVDRHAHLGFVSRIEILADDGRELAGGDLVEDVALFLVCVGERDSAGVHVWHRCLDCFVEEVVHRAVLGLDG